MFFWKKNKKIIQTTLILILFGLFFSFGTTEVEATGYASEPTQLVNTGNNFKTSIESSLQTISEKALEVKEYVLDGLAWTAANVLIDTFTDSIVDWINSGFEGSPMFVQDPGEFLKGYGNQLSGAFITEMGMEWLCSPLGKFVIDIDFFLPGTNRTKYECTFEDIVDNFQDLGFEFDVDLNIRQGANVETVFGNDFRNGGWPMWLAMGDPKNNKIGSTMNAADEVYSRAGDARDEEKMGIQIGGGFLGMRKCVEYENYDIPEYDPSDTTTSYTAQNVTSSGKCLKYETTTPGATVQDNLNKALGKDAGRLQVADEIDEIIGALATQFVSWIVTGGSGGEGLGAYTDSDSRAGDRDHYGALEDSQDTNSDKLDLSEKIDNMSKWEKKFKNSLSSMKTTLDERLKGLENILTKLNCIYDDKIGNFSSSVSCAALAESEEVEITEIKSITGIEGFESVDLEEVKIDETLEEDTIGDQIKDVEDKISNTESKLGYFEIGGKYYNDDFGWNYVEVSEWALDVLDNFSSDMLFATSKKKTNTVKKNYCFGDYDNNKEKGDICGEVSGEEEFGVKIWSEKTVVAEGESTNIYWYATGAEYCEREEGSGDSDWDLSFDESVSGSHKTKNFESDEEREYSIACYSEDGDYAKASATVSSLEGNSPVSSVEITASPTGTAFGGSVDLRWKGENVYGTCYLYSETKEYLSGFNLVDPNDYEDPWMDELGEGYYTEVDSNNYKGKETTKFEGEEGDDDYEVEYKIICHNGSEDEDGDGEIDVGEVFTGSVKVSVGALGKMNYTTQGESKAKDANTDANKEENRTSDQLKKYTCVLNEYTKVEDVDEDECKDLLAE